MRVNLLRTSGVIGLSAAAALLAAGIPASAATAGTGQGSAYGADASVTLLPGVLPAGGITVDTGKLAPSSTEGPTSASTVDAALKGLVTAKVITSSSNHDSSTGDVTSTAKLVDASLPVLAPAAGTTPTASVISSQCHSTADGITGSSDLADVNLGSIGHISAATPNLVLDVPGVVKVVADEQVHNADGSLTVNALHITLLGGAATGALGHGDIVLASSTCGPASAVTPPSTGGNPPGGGSGGNPGAGNPGNPGGGEVSVVPAGAPETGDGSLATDIVDRP
ncbi:MAG TPA: choice-of-anchor P family protein [Pseudonocardiaceae bacterium]|jgi:hypothetical protein|nr:choice-of-anchor P family protein [Pseudonocardiaceae bacterium]